MPYVPPDARDSIDVTGVEWLNAVQGISPGEMNYAISRIIGDYLVVHGLCYESINTVVGVLECAKLELYRRIAAPYEEKAIYRNGDIAPYERLDEGLQ